MPFPMPRTRRALIRRALAALAAADVITTTLSAPSRRAGAAARSGVPRTVPRIDPTQFAHLNTPAASQAMRQWQARSKDKL